MQTFTDTEGRLWNIKGTLGAFERVKTSCGVDMLDLPTTQSCLKQISDVFTLGRVLYVMCEEQANYRGLTPEQFADGFNADVLHAASEALIEEVIFFAGKTCARRCRWPSTRRERRTGRWPRHCRRESGASGRRWTRRWIGT